MGKNEQKARLNNSIKTKLIIKNLISLNLCFVGQTKKEYLKND